MEMTVDVLVPENQEFLGEDRKYSTTVWTRVLDRHTSHHPAMPLPSLSRQNMKVGFLFLYQSFWAPEYLKVGK